jgi:hypothetical protein
MGFCLFGRGNQKGVSNGCETSAKVFINNCGSGTHAIFCNKGTKCITVRSYVFLRAAGAISEPRAGCPVCPKAHVQKDNTIAGKLTAQGYCTETWLRKVPIAPSKFERKKI